MTYQVRRGSEEIGIDCLKLIVGKQQNFELQQISERPPIDVVYQIVLQM